MRRPRFVPVILGAAALALGSAEPPATSEGYAYSTYREVSGRLTVIVDSYPAAFHPDDRYVPLAVAVGLGGPGPGVLVTPESFTLLDGGGKEHGAASFEEIARNYPKRQFDASLLRARPMVTGNQFSTSLKLPANFYPSLSGQGTRAERIELAPFTWFQTVLYFPRPVDGLDGVLRLRLAGGGIDPPLEVRFAVPRFRTHKTH